jgi:hypothetical protein
MEDFRKGPEYLFAEVANIEILPECEPIHEGGAMGTQKHNKHHFGGSYRRHNCYQNFINRHTPYFSMTVVLSKSGSMTSHDLMEGDSLLAFKHSK